MEQLVNSEHVIEQQDSFAQVENRTFILSNTIGSSLEEIREKHVIPVFAKDNEPVISHVDFIEAMQDVVSSVYYPEEISKPVVRVSHAIKGRVPTARNKPASELLENEKTLYYERCAFAIEVPSISDQIDGNKLSLTIGGVKAYNLDHLYNKKGADETFKIYAGFKNIVCCNMCVTSDGFVSDLKVKDVGQLKAAIRSLVERFNSNFSIHSLKKLTEFSLTEQQFALLIGRCRLYQYLPYNVKKEIRPLLLSDTQLNSVAKDFYRDKSFCRDAEGNINLWKLYNLFTNGAKSSYVDTWLDRTVNAFSFVEDLKCALEQKTSSWFLN